MKKSDKFCFILFLLTCLLTAVSCNKSDDTDSNANATAETPLFHVGQVVNSYFYINGVLREEMADTIVNLGSDAMPALFYVNSSHTLDGAPVANGNHYSNVFRSLVRDDYYRFIILWGKYLGFDIVLGDTSAVGVQKRQIAFYDLYSYLLNNDIDFPLLVALVNDTGELKCARTWVEAASAASASGTTLSEPNTPDRIFRSLEMKGIRISEFSSAVHNAGMGEKDFLILAQNSGISLEKALMQIDSPKQTGFKVVCLVVMGVKMLVSWTMRFIKKGTAVPNLEDTYCSYLNDADSNVMNYLHRKDTISPTYKVAYCTLATAEFYVETYYDAYHRSMPGQYINRSGMIVKSVHCSWGMHVDGSTTFTAGDNDGTDDVPIATATGQVIVKYGDCCCYSRVGTLNFRLSADSGYLQTSWNPGH